MGKIFIIVGKSATGKDTIYKHLLMQEELNLKTVVMYTTRPIRKGETEGVEYHFVDENRLKELTNQNKVIEHRFYNTVHGIWHYFTVNDGQIDLDRYNYLMIGTLATYEQIRKFFGKDKVKPIYLEAPDDVRLLRSIGREQKQEQPKYAEVCRRYLADEEDFSEENLKANGITKRFQNLKIEECLSKVIQEIKNQL
ncbi:MAG: guanylate kinase [Clostridiales bacterium]|nr:guanylate kinase [Clostridiales bacterium]